MAIFIRVLSDTRVFISFIRLKELSAVAVLTGSATIMLGGSIAA